MFAILVFLAFVIVFFTLGIRILPEYERGVLFRLGRFAGIRTAGLRWIIPGIDRMVRIGLREIVMDVPAQEVITRDNVSVKVNAVLYFRVLHPDKAVIQVETAKRICAGSTIRTAPASTVSKPPFVILASRCPTPPARRSSPPPRPRSRASCPPRSCSSSARRRREACHRPWRPPSSASGPAMMTEEGGGR